MSDGIITKIRKVVEESAVDVANRMTKDFLSGTKITAGVGKSDDKPAKTAAEARRKQGEGFYQADIGR